MQFGGFKGQLVLHPKHYLGIKNIQYGGYNPRWRLTKTEMIENIFQTMI